MGLEQLVVGEVGYLQDWLLFLAADKRSCSKALPSPHSIATCDKKPQIWAAVNKYSCLKEVHHGCREF